MFGITFTKYWEWEYKRYHSEEEFSAKKKYFEEWVLDLMSALTTNSYSKVTFYPNRNVIINGLMFDADRNSMLPLEYMLAIKAGVKPDNHTVYEVFDGCKRYGIKCHDGHFQVGTIIQEGTW